MDLDATWELLDYDYAVALVDVDADLLRAELPPAFDIDERVGHAMPGRAQVGIEIDASSRGHPPYASIWTRARFPPAFEVAGYDGYVNFDTLVEPAPIRQMLSDAGLPARGGATSIGATSAALDLEGVGHFQIRWADPGQVVTPLTGAFLQYTRGFGDATARWRTNYAARSTTVHDGDIILPRKHWLASIEGASRLPAKILRGQWSYTGGRIEYPIPLGRAPSARIRGLSGRFVAGIQRVDESDRSK